MTTPSRRARRLAPPVAALLAAGTLAFTVTPADAATTTFSNASAISVGDGGTQTFSQPTGFAIPASGTQGQASVYPSVVNVARAGVITDVNVNIQGLTSTAPVDLDLMLVGPTGEQAKFMSDTGGGTANPVTNVSFSFDDEAPGTMPQATITPGSYKPTDGDPGIDPFDAPSPVDNGNMALYVFDGTNSAGVWKLFAMDDAASELHSITGWSLRFNLATSPYPSTIAVSGLPAVTDVNVGLHGLTSAYPDDIALLLVGPGSQQAVLWSDAGGGYSNALTDVNITLDDEAASPLPDDNPITSGSYSPTDYDLPLETFPAPAPVNSGNTLLSVFDGISPNGQWRLFAIDDTVSDLTTINGGWSLDFTWADNQSPTGTVAVNGGAAATSSANVTLNLTASDPAPASGVTQMRFSNDGVTFSAYQPFATTAAWTLASADGTKTVYAQFKDGDGNVSSEVTDAITLDTTGPKGTVTINAGALTTTTSAVTLGISANDPAPATGVTQMRLSNDGVTFTAYQPYAATAAWSLSAGDGTKTVYAQFKDAQGNESAVATDTVKLDSTGPRAKKLKPAKSATGVAAGVTVTIKATERLKGKTVTATSVYLKAKGASHKIKAQVSYNVGTSTILLIPKADLKRHLSYVVTVRRVQDLLGNRWDEKPAKSGSQRLRFSFTTA